MPSRSLQLPLVALGPLKSHTRGLKVIIAAISKGENLKKPPKCAALTACVCSCGIPIATETGPGWEALGVPGEGEFPCTEQHQNAAEGEQRGDLPLPGWGRL